MFENIRKCLDDYEQLINTAKSANRELTEEEKDFAFYFNMNFSKAIMQDYYESDIVAKIILADKNMLGDIKVKVE